MASATDAARASPSTLKANYGQEAYFKTDTVRVDNVSDRELEADVGRLFLRCGKIRSVTLPLDTTGNPQGYAIVRFDFWQAADKAMRLRPTQLGGKHVTRMRRVPKPSVTNKQPFNLGPASRRESAADRTPHASSAQPLPAQPQAAIDTLTQEPSKAGESGGVSVRSLDARSVLQPRSTGETAQPAQPQAEPEAPPAAAAPEAPPAAAAPYIVQHDLAVPSSGSTGAAVTAAQHNATSTGPNSEVVLSEKAKDVPAVPNEAAQPSELDSSDQATKEPASPQQGKRSKVSCCAVQ